MVVAKPALVSVLQRFQNSNDFTTVTKTRVPDVEVKRNRKIRKYPDYQVPNDIFHLTLPIALAASIRQTKSRVRHGLTNGGSYLRGNNEAPQYDVYYHNRSRRFGLNGLTFSSFTGGFEEGDFTQASAFNFTDLETANMPWWAVFHEDGNDFSSLAYVANSGNRFKNTAGWIRGEVRESKVYVYATQLSDKPRVLNYLEITSKTPETEFRSVDEVGKTIEKVEKKEIRIDKGKLTATQPWIEVVAPYNPGFITNVTRIPVEVKDIKGAGASDDVLIQTASAKIDRPTNVQIAFIEPHGGFADSPMMPQIEASIPRGPANLDVEWSLEVRWNRGNGAILPEDKVNVPNAGSTVTKKANEVWKIYQDQWWDSAVASNGFFGGHAVLTMKIGTAEQQFHFRIGGKNPDDDKCRNHISGLPNAGPSGTLWFAYAVAKHESKGKNTAAGTDIYNQFYELPRHTRDAGFPTWNPDDAPSAGGYGVFQVTGDVNGSHVNIPRRQIWNWHDNVTAALVLLADKRRQAVNWMQKPAANAGTRPSGQRPQTVFDTGGNVPVPNEPRTNITFADNPGGNPIEDACTIKLYNGDGGTGHYCSWTGPATPRLWKFNRTCNGDGKNYVELVCQEIK